MAVKDVIDHLIPLPCPYELIRIGGNQDGAYLVPSDLGGIEACFSPGVANTKLFEDELAFNYQIKSHLCDFSSDLSLFTTPLLEGMQTFEKAWLGNNLDSNTITLQDWIDRRCPDQNKDLLLQMDIEGAEYSIIPFLDEASLSRFRIIILELHNLGNILHDHNFRSLVLRTLSRLMSFHACVHAHPNNCCGYVYEDSLDCIIPNVLEVTLLRRDRFSGDVSRFIKPQLPHPCDITNALPKAPIHLNRYWDRYPKSSSSKLKALRDILKFISYEQLL